jgi:predicted TIM-barrel fold metal-dependent hydrolase
MSFYTTDNRYMLDVMRAHPGVFGGVAIVDENAPELSSEMKRLKDQGVRGFRIYASRQKAEGWLASPGMRNMWSLAGDEGLSMCLLADPEALPLVDRMCAQFPATPVVIDHCARIGMKGAISQADVDALCRVSRFPRTHVKISAFYALGARKPPYTDLGPMIHALRDSFGASRLMWASDCPFQLEGEHSYKASLELIRSGLDFLTPEDRDWILRKTAERVFFS